MKPNLIVILTDDQGRCDYSACGTRDIRTPNIDRMFHEGMSFENFFANSSVCSPSRAALLTGCTPDRVGVPGVIRTHAEDSWGFLDTKARLLPEILGDHDYHTALIGKWHLGLESPNLPNERGFQFFQGFLGDMMDDYTDHRRHGINYMRRNAEVIDPPGHATDIFSDLACDYLKDRAKETEKPFFLYLAYNAPHSPIQPPTAWLDKVKAREPAMDPKRQSLVALIEHLDDGIGRVLKTLDQTGLSENTLVVFTSDNGGVLGDGANNGPWRSEKGHMYDGGLRVPFAARWPGRIPAGSSTPRAAITMDIFSTFLSAAGIPAPDGLDGISFLPTLRGEPQEEAARDHYFVRREGGPFFGMTQEAIRRGGWKLVHDGPDKAFELFDTVADPGETVDLAGKEKVIFRELAGVLRLQVQRGGEVRWRKGTGCQ